MQGELTDAGPLTPQEPSRETSQSSIDGIEQSHDWPEVTPYKPYRHT